jgi:protein-tyrosine phosphatase
MIDIHAHVLPGCDDGPSDWPEALEFLRDSAAEGVTGIVCTSHVLDNLDNRLETMLLRTFEGLQKRVRDEGIPITLWLGTEIHCSASFDPRSVAATFNGNGRSILLELPMAGIPQGVEKLFFTLVLEGRLPILAHPERNTALVENLEKVYDFYERGVLFQVNAGSFLGHFGRGAKRKAIALLDRNLVHFVASDSHCSRMRSVVMGKAFRFVKDHSGEEIADRLFRIHPGRAVKGESVDPPRPLHDAPKKAGLFRSPGRR